MARHDATSVSWGWVTILVCVLGQQKNAITVHGRNLKSGIHTRRGGRMYLFKNNSKGVGNSHCFLGDGG